jgi:outer membrane protein TolC
MTTTGWLLTIALLTSAAQAARLIAQGAPPAPSAVWQPRDLQNLQRQSATRPNDSIKHEPDKTYTLGELIDLAERHNPETRVAWEQAKSKAAALGIARSALYPTMSAVALAVSLRQAALIGEFFHRQTEGIFEPVLHVEYLVFDVGGRSGEIDAAKVELLASDLGFNDTHRHIIYQVASAYYRLLNAEGQRQAAEVSLENAKAVEEDAKARLANGLATKPDELEATAARAQADFDLQAAIGAVDITRGELATELGLEPGTILKVQGIEELKLPSAIAGSVDEGIDRAFSQRPDHRHACVVNREARVGCSGRRPVRRKPGHRDSESL